jgi:uncharacterized Ntn-hydrolase superfamily protein
VTFSIVGRSSNASLFGLAIASSSPAVAARCAHVRAGIGAVASQNITDPSIGKAVLDTLQRGAPPKRALHEVLTATPYAEYRQVLALGSTGGPVIHSGAHSLGIVDSAIGSDAAAAGNLLARTDVPASMLNAFEKTKGSFGFRLLRALIAGVERGGEAGPIRSAGLMIARDVSWPIVDLRVDWTMGNPVAELCDIWQIYEPQINDYVHRALDPASAPAFNVPGEC